MVFLILLLLDVLVVESLVVLFVQVEPSLVLALALDGFVFELLQFCRQIAGCAGNELVKLDFELQCLDSCSTKYS